jgi:hypothetical protein
MSRYQPPLPRDRSPPRFSDRRPSINSYNGPPGPRNGDNPNQTPLDRAPPRGPKAQYDGPGLPRGRGSFRGPFGGRPEFRDRERDIRPPPISDRRDDSRPDWPRRERDFNSSDRGGFAPRGGRGYIGRDRSASPVRTRRGSSEAISVHNSRLEGSSNFYASPARGGYAGRGGRGDWDRNRGRGSLASERDRDFLPPRSRSREDFAARDRDRGRDLDLDRKERSDRWEPDASRDRDFKPRDHDVWQRDRSTGRQSSGSGPVSLGPPIQNRGDLIPSTGAFDPTRRRSTALTPGIAREWRRDGDIPDYFGRPDQSRDPLLSRKLSPPPAPPSAAASALDYGPPPVTKVSETPSDVPPPQRDPIPKIEPSATSSSSFLPPTGPKAERPAGLSNPIPPLKVTTNEQWPKPEPQPRTLRPAPAAPVLGRAPEQIRLQEQTRDAMDLDRQPQANVPSGPRASLLINKPRMISQQGAASGASSAGLVSTAKTSPVEFRSSIPTGPRSERDGLKARPGPPWPTGNATWTSPDYKPRPSIMNNLQSKPPFDGREIHRSPITAFNQPQKTRYQPPIIPRSRPSTEHAKKDEASARVVVTDDNGRVVKPEEETDSALDVDMSLNPSSDDEVDDDGLDEEDFAHSEEKFKKQMRQLEAMKPPAPLDDPTVVELLLKIQFLGLIIERVPLEAMEAPAHVLCSEEDPSVTGLLSPEQRLEDKIHGPAPRRILGRPLSKLPVNPILTPPLDDLPYLTKSSPEFQIFEESDDEVQHEAVITAVRTEFEMAAWQQREDIDEMRSFYNDQYPAWKRAVAKLDRLKLDAKQPSPRPATPVPPMPIIIAQPPTTERPSRASMRNATEYDMEKVLEESKIMEQERKEARDREAAELEASGARPDYTQEAVVPDMIDPSERDLSRFRDENWKIPSELALDMFEYIPPVDDFTEEEQVIFIKAFVLQPKRWGKIAESLPRRDYKQCIMHYYLTKNEASYKEILRQSQPRKKRGRVATKPRNTAMGDLSSSYDGGPIAVTDSGRPRRAAAPTFGEVGTDSEAVTPAPTGAKRVPRATDATAHIGDRPTRGRKAGTGTTKTRKTKKMVADPQQPQGQVLPDAPGALMSPQKVQPPTPRAPIHRFKEIPIMLEPAQPMEIQTSIEQDMGQIAMYQDLERNGMSGFPGNSAAPQITSYWSVPEQQKFPDLIAYFGRDFAAIADFMKTKSSTMIKNFYTRELNTGKKELEDAAKRAESMRERGEPIGPPPTPVAPPKRRYEATPSMASLPRPMTSHDMTGPEMVHGVATTGTTMINDFPADVIQRGARGELVAKPRASRDILGPILAQPGPHRVAEEVNQPTRTPLIESKQGSGPRPGYFPQERQEIRPASQGIRGGILEQTAVASQPPHRLSDYAREFEQLQQQRQSQFQQQAAPLMQETPNRTPLQPDLARRPVYQTEPPNQQPPRDTLGHIRRDSAGMSTAPPRERWDRDADPTAFRREPPHRGLQYSPMSTQPIQPGFPAMADARREVTRPASTPLVPPAEAQKQAPTKRSNIFSLLDDGPPEPAPPKRASLEGAFSQSVQSPSLPTLAHDAMRQRPPPRVNTPLAPHGSRSHYLQTPVSRPGQPSVVEYSTNFGGSPAQSGSHDKWIARWDPRQPQSGIAEHSPIQIQPPIVQYGSTNAQPSISRLQMDIPARQETSHRSTLAQLQHPGHAPSPPPSMSIRSGAAIPPFRSASNSSQQHQHIRVTSLGYPPSQSQQLPGHSGSAGSTPVSAMHQGRPSLSGYDDQRFAQQREHQLRDQQMRDHQQREQQVREQAREQEARQRDYDMRRLQQDTYMQAQQQQRAQEMEQERYRYPGGPPRTFTPPTGQFTTPQQQQPQPPPASQRTTHYRNFSQGGGEERR